MSSSLKLNSDNTFIKVLIVDNISYSINLLRKECKSIGLFVLTANSCSGAIEKVLRYKPHLLIVTHELPDSPLDVFLDEVKSSSRTKVLFLSSSTSNDLIKDELKILIDSIIHQPINREELKIVVGKLLYRKI